MSDIAIRVENCILSADLWSGAEGLCKLYHIGARQQRHDTPSTRLRAAPLWGWTGLRDALVSALPRITRISRKGKDNSSNSTEGSWQKDSDLWALKDVSFEVKRGAVIGRNGAEKSRRSLEDEK